MTTLINNLTDYVNDDDIGVGFVASIFAIVLSSSLFFTYNLLVVPEVDRIEKFPASYAKAQIYQPSPLKPTL